MSGFWTDFPFPSSAHKSSHAVRIRENQVYKPQNFCKSGFVAGKIKIAGFRLTGEKNDVPNKPHVVPRMEATLAMISKSPGLHQRTRVFEITLFRLPHGCQKLPYDDPGAAALVQRRSIVGLALSCVALVNCGGAVFVSAQMKWNYFTAAFLLLWAVATAEGEIWEEDEHEILIRSERGTKNREPCRYDKGPWSGCDGKNNMRSRTLTLKKGDKDQCEPNKIIQKKCKKACRYEKGTWSECNAQNKIIRTDTLKANSDASCEQSREITKNCKGGKQASKTKTDNKRKGGAKGGNRRNKQ